MMQTNSKPYMMLGLPNTGTDWFADIISANSNLKYSREFFNPIVNEFFAEEIAKMFGCELPSTSYKIAQPHTWEEYENVLNATWKRTAFNFTKENYSAFQIEHHVKAFNCFVLHRDVRFSLPSPDRTNRVKTWYDTIYHSMVLNRDFLETDVQSLVDFAISNANTINKKQVSAHIIGYYKTLKDAKKYRLPVIKYETLVTESEENLCEYLNKNSMWRLGSIKGMVRDIINSRKPRMDMSGHLHCDEYIKELENLLK